MAIEFFIPKLGQTVEEVTLVNWLVEDGAKVSQGQEVMEVETDKAIFPVEANGKGYIHIGPYKAGEVLPVLTVVAIIGKETDTFMPAGEPGEPKAEETPAPAEQAAPEPGTAPETTPAAGTQAGKIFASPRARKLAASKKVELSQVNPSGWGGLRVAERDVLAYLSKAPKATPVAQRMASEMGMDLRELTGTGPGGRIIKEDVELAMKPAETATRFTTAPRFPAAPPPFQPPRLPATRYGSASRSKACGPLSRTAWVPACIPPRG